jgi:hypothetical protein
MKLIIAKAVILFTLVGAVMAGEVVSTGTNTVEKQAVSNSLSSTIQPTNNWPVWMTVKLGTPGLKTADDFRKALIKAGWDIDPSANYILGQPAFTVSNEEKELELVEVSAAELGFKNGATRADIYRRALELGLDLCPAEVGPQAVLQFGSQLENGTFFLIGMEPITFSDGYQRVFDVHNFYGEYSFGLRRLSTSWFDPDPKWDGVHVVFLRRKLSK